MRLLLILCEGTKFARRQDGGQGKLIRYVDTTLLDVFLEFQRE